MIRFGFFLKILHLQKNFFSLDNFDLYTTEFPKGHIFICFTQGILCRTAPTVNGLILKYTIIFLKRTYTYTENNLNTEVNGIIYSKPSSWIQCKRIKMF